jgi:WD40 repeat protein
METIPANPFKGLRPYSQQDRDKLFGRDRDLILMKDRIFSARTTLLFAGSGVGKTSFLNAKVIPELKKQCVVVWHNRWTGADEVLDEAERKHEPIRFWPPQAMFREIVRKFRSLGGGDYSVAPATRDPLSKTDDPFELEVRKIISQNLRRSAQPPQRLSEALACFSKAANPDATNRCILILDQFEEVFQYHAYEDYFRDFVKDLCEVVNDEDYQVRVVFSMREEFLGELSVFDNRIPDLFSNYYRLRYPDKEEAADIIRRTCQLSDIDPDPERLPSLVEDLSKIAKGSGSFAERSTTQNSSGVHVIKRDFVAPPYLQIACERLWNNQYATDGNKQELGTTLTGEPKNKSPFLFDYTAGSDNGNASGGDAQRAVVGFCEEKLSPPFLSRNEQDIVARAFSFLVTKQGAKMAYELSSLADHMEERVRPLKTALEKLSQDQAKILRESRGPDRSYWFELYHDMYATIVDDWKVRYLAGRRKRYLAKAGFTVLIILLSIAVYYWIVAPRENRKRLASFTEQVCSAGEQAAYADAVSAYTRLSNTWGYRRTANSMWAQILERRAQCFEKNNDPSSAILSLLKAVTLEHDAQTRQRMATAAITLMGAPNGSLIATYCDDCKSAALSPDGTAVLSLNLDGDVRLWDSDTGQPRGETFCSDCRQSRPAARKALFSADGQQVLTVAGVRRCDEGAAVEATTTESGLKIQIWGTADRAELLTRPICLIDKQESTPRTTSGPTFSKEGAQDRPESVPPTIDIRAFAKVGSNYWIAGVRGDQILVWDSQGGGRTIGASRNAGQIGVIFSPDGLYLAGVFANEAIKLWRVTESEIKPVKFKNPLAITFGPKHQLLTAEDGDILKVIDLDSGNALVTVNPKTDQPDIGALHSIGFSPNGEQFIARMRNPEGDHIRAWRTANGEPLFNFFTFKNQITRSGLSGDGRTLLAIADGDPPVVEKWDLQTQQMIGALKRKFDTVTFRPDRCSMLMVSGTTARLWGLDSDSSGDRIVSARNIDPYDVAAGGRTLLTINDGYYLQFWNADTANAMSEPISLGAQIRLATLSSDGNYAAADTNDGAVRVWQTGNTAAIAMFQGQGESRTLSLSADGHLLARGAANDVKIWNVSAMSEIDLRGHMGEINDVALTNRFAITGSNDKTARIWDVTTGQLRHNLVHEAAVGAVAIAADGRLALTGCEDGAIRLWDVETGARLSEIRVKDAIGRIKFSSDGTAAAILTASWMYLARVNDNALTYKRGILIADPWSPAFDLSSDGKKVSFAYLFGGSAVQLQNLDLEPTAAAEQLAKNPEQALHDWEKKLGLRVTDLGRIGKMWENTPLADAEKASQAKKPAQ